MNEIGLAAFDSLRAEDEPWLDDCFIPPPDLDLLVGARSALVFGAAGSGKTALHRAIRARLAKATASPARLVVDWTPPALPTNLSPSEAAKQQLTHILGRCADRFLAHLRDRPDRFAAAPADVQRTLTWFVHRFLEPELEQRLAAHVAEAQEPARSLLRSLLTGECENEWLSAAEPAAVIDELMKALREVGVGTVCVLLGPDTLTGPDLLNNLVPFLSSLTLFENRHFLYKVIVSDELRRPLSSAGAVDRRRMDTYPLDWFPDDLIEIVLARISLAVGGTVDDLSAICEDDKLARWLERTGGASPRGWLRCVAPLVARYLRKRRPITAGEWKTLRRKSPPPLTFDAENETVTVGWRAIDDLSEIPLALLRYLYEHRDRVCTRHELYHRAYLPVAYPDTPPEKRREYPAEYDHILDTAISRLREKIEPDRRSPIYVVTYKGKGYRLEHAW